MEPVYHPPSVQIDGSASHAMAETNSMYEATRTIITMDICIYRSGYGVSA